MVSLVEIEILVKEMKKIGRRVHGKCLSVTSPELSLVEDDTSTETLAGKGD